MVGMSKPNRLVAVLGSLLNGGGPGLLVAHQGISAQGGFRTAWQAPNGIHFHPPCDPPQTFTYGGGAIAHVLTFSAHCRTLALGALHDAGITDRGSGDPMRFERSARPSQP